MSAKLRRAGDNAEVSKVPKRTPYLVLKGNRYYFRIRVPLELVEAIGKKEITQALGDVNRAQAEVRAGQLAADWLARFLAERHRLGLAESPPAPPIRAQVRQREATVGEVRALAQAASRSMLASDMEARIEGSLLELNHSPDFGPGRPIDEALKGAVSGREMDGLAMQAEDWLCAHGLELPADLIDRRRALMAWAMEVSKGRKGQKLRDEGEPVETPEPVALPSSLVPAAEPQGPDKKTADTLKLRDVLELWKTDERQRPAKTIQKAELAVSHYEKLTGNPSLAQLSKPMGAEFRRALLADEKLSPKTASDRLSWVHIMLNFEALRYGRIPANPWKGLSIRVTQSTVREEWKDADACKLFALPLFQRY